MTTASIFFIVFSNIGALVLGYIFGKIFRWKCFRTRRGVFIVPWVGKVQGHDVLILLLAGVAVMSTYSTVLDTQQHARYIREQLRCNEQLEEAISLREQAAKRYATMIDSLVNEFSFVIATDDGMRGPEYQAELVTAFEHYQDAFSTYMEERPSMYNRDPEC